VSQIGPRPDHADLEHAGAPALTDASVEDGRLLARIGADNEQRIGLLDAGDGPDALAVDAAGLGGNHGKSFRPGSRAQLAVLADIGAIKSLSAQTVDDVAGLVGDPFLVHRLIDARQDTHHLAAAGVHADRRAHAVHDVDRLRLAQFPGP